MNQRFAIIRPNSESLSLDQLKKALTGVPGLTPADASIVCNGCNGLPVRNVTEEQAQAILANLKAGGVEAEIIGESQLPVLPMAKVIRKLEITDEALGVFDVIGRKVPVPWDKVQLIAAGSLQLMVMHQTRIEWEEKRLAPISFVVGVPIQVTETKSAIATRESTQWQLRLEILLTDGTTRYTIEGENFQFAACLGAAATKDPSSDFCLLVRELVKHAPGAALTEGAASIRLDPPSFAYYPRKTGFYDEMTWVLWDVKKKS